MRIAGRTVDTQDYDGFVTILCRCHLTINCMVAHRFLPRRRLALICAETARGNTGDFLALSRSGKRPVQGARLDEKWT